MENKTIFKLLPQIHFWSITYLKKNCFNIVPAIIVKLINFNLIIIDTTLLEFIISTTASTVGKTILHLDPNSFYGSHFASLSLHNLTSLHSLPFAAATTTNSDDVIVIDLIHQPLCSDVEIVTYDECAFLNKKFSIDLGGLRALFYVDKMINLLMKSGTAQYLEFKGNDESFVYEANAGLANVSNLKSTNKKNHNL